MSIVTILQDAVPAGSYFSYGTTFDQNIVMETDGWMYLLEFPLRGNTNFELGYTTYECVLLIGKFSKFELEVNDHINIIQDAETRLQFYLNTLWGVSNTLTGVRISHFKNRYDANLSGARSSFFIDVPMDTCLTLPD